MSTTTLEWGEASRSPETISSAVLGCMSSCVTMTSGLVQRTRSAASGPVEEAPTTSTPPRKARMDSRPSLNMVWSSARCTRTALTAPPVLLGVPRAEEELLFGPVEGRQHVLGADLGHAPGVPVGRDLRARSGGPHAPD